MHSTCLAISLALTAAVSSSAQAQWVFTPMPRVPGQPPVAKPVISATHVDPKSTADRAPPAGLLTPIPSTGVPAIFSKSYGMTAEKIRARAKARDYARQINAIKHNHFGKIKVSAIRDQGIEQLQEFTDPAAFRPMIEELARESDDVRLAVLDHFARQSEEGQAALGWVAIFDKDAAIRNEAMKRMTSPAGEPVKYLLNGALRNDNHDVVCSAATLAGALNVTSAIPLLIFAQATTTDTGGGEGQGDLAWIAIQTQRAYVQNLVPVVGDNSGAYEPVIGIVSEGVVMRVVDAVAIEYRTPVHSALVALSTHDWGNSTEYLSYNIQAWWDWYNNEYVPFKNEQSAKATLAGS